MVSVEQMESFNRDESQASREGITGRNNGFPTHRQTDSHYEEHNIYRGKHSCEPVLASNL